MTKILKTLDAKTPADLAIVLMQLFSEATLHAHRDIHPDEFVFDDGEERRVSLVLKTLTDGSTVYNIAISSPAPATLEADAFLAIRQGYADGLLSGDDDEEEEEEESSQAAAVAERRDWLITRGYIR